MASLLANLSLLLTFVTVYNGTYGYSWSGLGRFNSYDTEQDSSNSSNIFKAYLNKFCEFPKTDDILLQISQKLSQESSSSSPSDEDILEKLKNELNIALQLRSNILRVLNHLLSYTNFTDNHKNEIQALELLIKGLTNREFFIGKLLPLAGILDKSEKVKNLKIMFHFLGDILPNVYKSSTEVLDDFVDKEQDDSHLKEVIPFLFYKIKPNINLTPKYIDMDLYFKELFKMLEKNIPGILNLDSELIGMIFQAYPYFSNIMQIQEYLADISSNLKKNPQVKVLLGKDDLNTKNLLGKISDTILPDTTRRSLGNEQEDAQLGIPESKKEQINLINKIFKNLAKYELPEDITKGLDILFNKKRQLLSVLPHMNTHNNVMETVAELLSIIVRLSEDNPKVPKKILPLAKSLYQNLKFKFLYNENNYKDLDKMSVPKILDFYGHISNDDFQKKLINLKQELLNRNNSPITIKFGADPKKILMEQLAEILQENKDEDDLVEKIKAVVSILDNSGNYIVKNEEPGNEEVDPIEEPKRRNVYTTGKPVPIKSDDIVYVQNSYDDYVDSPKSPKYNNRKNGGRKFNSETPAIQETATPTYVIESNGSEDNYPGMDETITNHKNAISNLADLKRKLERFFNPTGSRRNLENEPDEAVSTSTIFKKLENLLNPSNIKKATTPKVKESSTNKNFVDAIKDYFSEGDTKPSSRIDKEDEENKLKPADALKYLLSNSGFSQRDVVNLYNGLYDLENRDIKSEEKMPFNDFLTSLYEKSKDYDLSPFKHSLKKGVVPDSLINLLNGKRRNADPDEDYIYSKGKHVNPDESDNDDNRKRGTPRSSAIDFVRKMLQTKTIDELYKSFKKHHPSGRDKKFEKVLLNFVNENMDLKKRRSNSEDNPLVLPNIDQMSPNIFSVYKDLNFPNANRRSEDFFIPQQRHNMNDLKVTVNGKEIPLTQFIQTIQNIDYGSNSRRAASSYPEKDNDNLSIPQFPTAGKGKNAPIKDMASLTRFLNNLVASNISPDIESRKAINYEKIINTFQEMLNENDSSFRRRNPKFLEDFLNPQRRNGAPEDKVEPKDPEDKLKVILATGVLSENQVVGLFKDYKDLPENNSRRFLGLITGFAKWIWDSLNEKINLPKLVLTAGTHLLEKVFGKSASRRSGTSIDDDITIANHKDYIPVSGQRRSAFNYVPEGERRSVFGEEDNSIYKLQKFDPVPKLWKTLWECNFSTGAGDDFLPHVGANSHDYESFPPFHSDLSHNSFSNVNSALQTSFGNRVSKKTSTFESTLESRMENLFKQLKAETVYESEDSKKTTDIPKKEHLSDSSLSSFISKKLANIKSNIKNVMSFQNDFSKTTNDFSTDQSTKGTTKLVESTTVYTETPWRISTEQPESTRLEINTQKSARRFMQNDSFDLKSKESSKTEEVTTSVPKTTENNSKLLNIRSSLEEEMKKRSLQNNMTIIEENGTRKKKEEFEEQGHQLRRKNASEIFSKS